MKLTPIDIRRQRFRKRFFGLDPEGVYDFLDLLSNQFEELIIEKNEMSERINDLENRVKKIQQHEKTLMEVIHQTKKIEEDIKKNARKEAELIIADAMSRAERYEQSIKDRLSTLINQIEELKIIRDRLFIEIRSRIQEFFSILDASLEEFKRSDKIDHILKLYERLKEGEITPPPDNLTIPFEKDSANKG